MGLLALATAEEKKNDCKQAVRHYSEAANINAALRDRAIMGKGRCSEQLGDTKGAIAAYKEYQQNNPDASLAVRLAELEAKAGGQAASK
jgi:tetratricopeptide (TPR) repeat protein